MSVTTILIKGPRVIDPANGIDEVTDILVKDGQIATVGAVAPEQIPEGTRILEASGLVASPGFIDIHCHLREPGFEYKETITTGTKAAARAVLRRFAVCPTPSHPSTTRP